MKILTVAFGNIDEAYVENSLQNRFNIVSSDDNNKGKTILVQSMMYALGNVPTFPSSFNYQAYFYYIKFEVNNREFTICRRNSNFIVKNDSEIMVLEGVSELKRYWNSTISALPQIIKDDTTRIVDPELFLQLFFVGQDKKDTSNIVNRGYYSKDDFYNMLFSMLGYGAKALNAYDVDLAKKRLNQIKEERDSLLKQFKILKSNQSSAAYLSASNDRYALEGKIRETEQLASIISTLRIERNKLLNRKTKHDVALRELQSLNRTVDGGELRCLSCNSSHIGFITDKKKSYTFDVTTSDVRKQIINSIKEKINSYCEEIDRITNQINEQQQYLSRVLTESNITLESIVLLKSDIVDAEDAERKIFALQNEYSMLRDSLKSSEMNNALQRQKQDELISTLASVMQEEYRRIDNSGNLIFDDIFTRKDEIFSGSEATLFYLIRMYALCIVTNHSYPLVFESFRAEDLSTEKENKIIDLFKQLDNQIIFTTTLKKQELGKYDADTRLNNIDYSVNLPSKILSHDNVYKFLSLLADLKIVID